MDLQLSERRASGTTPQTPVYIQEPQKLILNLSKSRSWIVITQLCGINFISSFSSGLLTIGLPTIATALDLSDSLLVWPTSVSSLTSGSCLLIAGSLADVLGPRRVSLVGCLFIAIFVIACGLARSGIELILFRAFQGIGSALFIPSAVSMVSTNIEHGRPRNLGFAFIFLAYPLGYGLGLVLGGIFVNTVGWRVGFFAGGATGFFFFLVGIWTLPKDPKMALAENVKQRLSTEIDWVGALMASICIATFSYVLARLSADATNFKKATNIGLLVFTLALALVFPAWMQFRQKQQKVALMPNSLWKKKSFTSLLSAIETSVRLLPQVAIGTGLCVLSGMLINKISVLAALLTLTILCAIAPLLMAIADPGWPYWYCEFWAQLLTPLSVDVTLTIGTLIVTEIFPTKTQALAGAVFNTFSQLGISIGLCILSVISTNVTNKSRYTDARSPQALLEGYRASFWALFAWTLASFVIGIVGLRNIGKIGGKKD
ncbi:Drug resistance protein [Lachnellula suecica]|uniref:Drug resistance protein n=1 Tax=Lachnellula suecica TaxID=602035 RepID=A0A8T9C3F6_9HELO|nr:Drug resistance protein [Lachnellula suecica]